MRLASSGRKSSCWRRPAAAEVDLLSSKSIESETARETVSPSRLRCGSSWTSLATVTSRLVGRGWKIHQIFCRRAKNERDAPILGEDAVPDEVPKPGDGVGVLVLFDLKLDVEQLLEGASDSKVGVILDGLTLRQEVRQHQRYLRAREKRRQSDALVELINNLLMRELGAICPVDGKGEEGLRPDGSVAVKVSARIIRITSKLEAHARTKVGRQPESRAEDVNGEEVGLGPEGEKKMSGRATGEFSSITDTP